MNERVEAIALGAGWVIHLKAEARQALRDFPVAIGAGSAITVGMVLALPWGPWGLAAFTCAMVMMLGMLSWTARRRGGLPFPLTALVGLSLALLLLEAPVLLLLAEGSGAFIGAFVWLASVVIGTVLPPSLAMGFLLAIPAFVGSVLGLGACFAPHLVAAQGTSVPQALRLSLLVWMRNPLTFLAFAGLGVALAAFRIVALWIAAIILFPVPALASVLAAMLWTAAVMLCAAALVGFGRAALPEALTETPGIPESRVRFHE